jgi:ribosome-associated translation inhibitor RaiA
MSILRQVTLQRAARKSDKSISISFVTSLEETTEAFMEVDRLVNTSGVIYYSEKGTLTQQEKDEIDKVEIEVEGKTKSQRMKSVLHVLWTQRDCSNKDAINFKPFDQFYADEMERIISHYKDKLEDR